MRSELRISSKGNIIDIDFLLCNKRITIDASCADSIDGHPLKIYCGTACILDEKRTYIRIGEELWVKGTPMQIQGKQSCEYQFSQKEVFDAILNQIGFLHLAQEQSRYWYCENRDFIISLIELSSVITF